MHKPAFEIEADELVMDERYVIFANRAQGAEDDVVVAAIRFDHFKSAVKMEMVH
jgi:hypothetical protein